MTLYIDTKPKLEWVDQGQSIYEAQDYLIEPSRNTTKRINLWRGESMAFLGEFNTLSEAKAAAQADYERRTAERFVKVELPKEMELPSYDNDEFDFVTGYNCALRDLQSAIANALEATP